MAYIEIFEPRLSGSVRVPSSKSIGHRAVIAAGLAAGESILRNVDLSEDIVATMDGMRELGAEITSLETAGCYRVNGVGYPKKKKGAVIDCRESGSTLRFLIPVALLDEEEAVITGCGRLGQRPLDPYYEIFMEQGIKHSIGRGPDSMHLALQGVLHPGRFVLPGNISSQFVSGLLFALPLLDGNSEIIIDGFLESRPYIDLTLQVLQDFGITVEENEVGYRVTGGQHYKSCDYSVESDWSQAAFWIVAASIGREELILDGLRYPSRQGDCEIYDILESMGGQLNFQNGRLHVAPAALEGIRIDASDIPDLVPVLAVLASVSRGRTEIFNAGRLRLKESDRLAAITDGLTRLGADIKELPEGLVINGAEHLTGGEVEGWGDHRIVMSMAVAALRARGEVVINGSQAVKKSYPKFFEDYKSLGGVINERSLG